MDVFAWQDAARLAGYDRLVIHDRDYGDAQEVGSFLSVYRRGQSWSRWGFARSNGVVNGWCCLTGMDVGAFSSMAQALGAVLNGQPADSTRARGAAPIRRGAVVTQLTPRMKRCDDTMGSAA